MTVEYTNVPYRELPTTSVGRIFLILFIGAIIFFGVGAVIFKVYEVAFSNGQNSIIQNQTQNLTYTYLDNGTVKYTNISQFYQAGQMNVIETQTKEGVFYFLNNGSVQNVTLQAIYNKGFQDGVNKTK